MTAELRQGTAYFMAALGCTTLRNHIAFTFAHLRQLTCQIFGGISIQPNPSTLRQGDMRRLNAASTCTQHSSRRRIF